MSPTHSRDTSGVNDEQKSRGAFVVMDHFCPQTLQILSTHSSSFQSTNINQLAPASLVKSNCVSNTTRKNIVVLCTTVPITSWPLWPSALTMEAERGDMVGCGVWVCYCVQIHWSDWSGAAQLDMIMIIRYDEGGGEGSYS